MTLELVIYEGAEVLTSDDVKLGTVAERDDGAVRVNVGMRPDYWLPLRHVASANARTLRLDFPISELGKNLVPEPPTM